MSQIHRRRPRILLAASFLVSVVAAVPAGAQKAPVPTPDSLARMNDSIDVLTRKVWPSVVQILVSSYGAREEPEGRGGASGVVFGRQRSVGSGFVIDPDGYIMTNAHVVSGAQRVQIALPADNADGTLGTALSSRMKLVPARIVGITTELDLALLKVEGVKLAPLPLATYSQVRQGETVFAFGSPMGMRNSLTHGLVSAVARQVDPDSPLIYVQTDAPINPGNSGGPLVNIRGEVVGVNTFIVSQSGGNEGLGFAIPSATTRTVFKQLKEHGLIRRQEIGVSLQTISPVMASSLKLPKDYGVIVSDVWPGGPAEGAGLQIGDILVSVDGQPADNLPTVIYNFRLRDSSDKVQLVVLRGTTQQTLSVQPIEMRAELDAVSAMADPERNLVPEIGILGVEIDARIAAAASGLRAPYGVIVAARASGALVDVPLQANDVIRSVNDRKVATLAQLREVLRALPPGAPVTLQVQREGRLTYVSFTFD
ncbi:MAG TPA: trypsin-like peptidase domain-containing protein [Vicinamibacterales bacterium]|nr:trypsin-like peptidase domain-containing protein [Vicinamibacterales bacterium]